MCSFPINSSRNEEASLRRCTAQPPRSSHSNSIPVFRSCCSYLLQESHHLQLQTASCLASRAHSDRGNHCFLLHVLCLHRGRYLCAPPQQVGSQETAEYMGEWPQTAQGSQSAAEAEGVCALQFCMGGRGVCLRLWGNGEWLSPKDCFRRHDVVLNIRLRRRAVWN